MQDRQDDEVLEEARARVGTTLGEKYRVDRLIGIGGMAAVFAATHLRNGNQVALKVLHRDLARSADLRTRFLREGYAANSVGHDGTVRVLDDDKAEDGAIFLVMELLDGETLDARLERSNRKLGVSEVVALLLDTLDVLAAAHAKGIVHRDVKPENLFLTRKGAVKILDFGIARLRGVSSKRTGRGTSFGTPAFMPPEQALGRSEDVDMRSDVWALGATAFTLLSGRYVHEAPTAAEITVKRATLPAPKLATVAPDVPQAIAEVVDRALAFERDDRWPSAAAMKDALANARSTLIASSDIDEDDREEHTKVSPPSPSATSSPQVELAPPGDVSSTVGGVTTSRDARRARSRRKAIALSIIGVAMVGSVVVLALVAGSQKPAPPPPAASPLPPRAATILEAPAATAREPAMPPPTERAEAPTLPVDALPKATLPAPAVAPVPAPKSATSPAPRPRTVATPATAPAPTTPAPKHDPLDPW
jgi:eukaryotic-like serine/threonine-protein kinase